MSVDKKIYNLLAIYAPAKNSPVENRIDFFNRLRPIMTTNTVMGIDANCVPDRSIDLKREASSPYNNTGAEELNKAVDEKGLSDITRETIGQTPFFTSHHIVAGGKHCWTRIEP